MGTPRYVGFNAGTATAGLTGGGVDGYQPPALSNVEEFNGTAWSEGNNLNTAKKKHFIRFFLLYLSNTYKINIRLGNAHIP